MNQIKNAIRKAAQNNAEIYSMIGTVESVNTQKRSCIVKPVDGSPEIMNVRYAVTESDSAGFILTPKKGAFVIVNFLDDNNAFVSLLTEFDTIMVKNPAGDLKEILSDLITQIKAITVSTPSGQSGTPINGTLFDPIQNAIDGLFE